MIKKIIYIFILILLLIFIFDDKILNYFLSKKITDWTEQNAELNFSKLDYLDGKFEIDNITVREKNDSLSKIFESNFISIDINYSSIFSNLVTFSEVNISNPKFYFNVESIINELDDKKLIDNLDNTTKDKPKIYPLKSKDKNFLISDLSINNFKVIIKYPDNNKNSEIILSQMFFKRVGTFY